MMHGMAAANSDKRNAVQPRRASMGPAVLPGRWGDHTEEDDVEQSCFDSRSQNQALTGNSVKSCSSRRLSIGGSDRSILSRRSSIGGSDKSIFSKPSIARISRSQIGKAQRRLSLKSVGNVEYLTRDSLIGRSA